MDYASLVRDLKIAEESLEPAKRDCVSLNDNAMFEKLSNIQSLLRKMQIRAMSDAVTKEQQNGR